MSRRAAARGPVLADFGLTTPLTDRQGAALVALLNRGAVGETEAVAMSPASGPELAVLNRMGLAHYRRDPLGGERLKRSQTVWWLTPLSTALAFAIRDGADVGHTRAEPRAAA